MFSSKSLTFRSVTHFELVFVGGVHVDIQLSLPRLLKDFFSPLNGLGILVENQFIIVYFWAFCFMLWPVCLSLTSAPHCFHYCSCVMNFEIRKCDSSNFALFQDCFGSFGSLQFHRNFRISFSNVCKKPQAIRFWIGIALNL